MAAELRALARLTLDRSVQYTMISILKKLNRGSNPFASFRPRASSGTVPGRNAQAIDNELRRIQTSPRYRPLTTRLLGAPVEIVDGLSFYYSYREIFGEGIYDFVHAGANPVIIDGGSNIGLSVAWFRQQFPGSRITAFEADPLVFDVLQRNMQSLGYHNVQLENKALWNSDTELEFAVEGADGGRLSRDGRLQPGYREIVRVPAARLRPWLAEKVDMLKLDIEGAEHCVLMDCADALHHVSNIFVEYHSFEGQRQTLDEILNVLIAAGFRIQIHTQFCSPQPLIRRTTQLGMDLQLNIFGYREPECRSK